MGCFLFVSEVVCVVLRMFEQEEIKKEEIIKELKKGEKFGFVKDFNCDFFMDSFYEKYVKNEL